jgi:uncharacterized membrane protein
MLLTIHVVAGGLALVLGAVALLVRKGGTFHRGSGLLFVYAMVVMGISASILGNGTGGLVTVYFVGTALTTVRPVSSWTRRFNLAALIFAVVFTMAVFMKGVQAFYSPRGLLDGVPFLMFFFLATVTGLAAIGDVRISRFGELRGGPRLARHLWRMCFALFIAAGSFFSVPARVARILPEPFTSAPMRVLPILFVFGAMFYWLWRVRRRRTLPEHVRHDSMSLAIRAK